MERETGENPAVERRSAAGAAEQSAERVGPVAIERLRKDDGRALILYSRGGERP
jgi:hypothetical protein